MKNVSIVKLTGKVCIIVTLIGRLRFDDSAVLVLCFFFLLVSLLLVSTQNQ